MPVVRRLPHAAALGALALGITACGDSTGPGGSIDVTVSVTAQDEPILSVGPDSFPTIRCVMHLRAAATGSGRATWLDAELRFYFGADRSRPVDSTTVPAEIVQQGWGKPDIQAGETPQSGLGFTANIPFAVDVLFHYRPEPGGGIKTAQVGFDCGPTPSPTTSPPVITALTVEPPTSPLQPGDSGQRLLRSESHRQDGLALSRREFVQRAPAPRAAASFACCSAESVFLMLISSVMWARFTSRSTPSTSSTCASAAA